MAANNVAGSTTSADQSADESDRSTPNGAALARVASAKIEEVVGKALLDGTFGGAAVVASLGGETVCSKVWGQKAPAAESGAVVEPSTVFDLDSLTGSICTTTLLMRLVDAGRISVTERACRYLQPLGIGQKAHITVAQLLSNTSGFAAAASIYDELTKANTGSRLGILSSSGAKQYAYGHFLKGSLRYEPGQRHAESAVNTILLGAVIENVTGMSLERAFQKYVAAPVQLKSLGFIDVAMLRRRHLSPITEFFMPSGECGKRGRVVAGEVWDENAYVMGGVSGHSGLFGTARDVHSWATEILNSLLGESELISQRTALSFWETAVVGAKGVSRFGFDLPDAASGFVELAAAPEAGVVSSPLGSSVFIDPRKRAVVVILSNAGYSGGHNRRFVDVRGEIHSAILQ